MVRLGIAGGTGRMGAALLEVLSQDTRFSLGPVRGREHSGVSLPQGAFWVEDAQALFEGVDVVVDFTSPQASAQHLTWARQTKTPLLIGTTNLDAALLAELDQAARVAPLLLAPNTSLGIAVLEVLVETATKALKDFDIEIVEAHHRHKKDAPSGTAKSLLAAITRALGASVEGGRPPESLAKKVGMSSLRAGGVLGDHEVLFVSEEERVSLAHHCLDRRLFARGALHGAYWLSQQLPGLYTMRDSLGLL